MKIYTVTKGSYDDEHIVDVVMESDFPAYLKRKQEEFMEALNEWVEKMNGSDDKRNHIRKTLSGPEPYHHEGGSFGVQMEYLNGPDDKILKHRHQDGLQYEVHELWKE